MDRITTYPRLLTLATVIVVVGALYFARVILVPFAVAMLLAFLLSPIVNRIHKLGIPRVLAVIAVIFVAIGIACGIGWVVVRQLNDIVTKLPEYQTHLQSKFATVKASVLDPLEKVSQTVTDIARPTPESAPGRPEIQPVNISNKTPLLGRLLEPFGQIVTLLGSVGVVFLFVVLMLIQKQDMRDRLIRLSGSHLYLTTRAFDEAGAKVSRYVVLTTIINGAHGLCIGIALFALDIPNAILWGVMAAMLRFIPYLGPWIAAIFPVTLALAVFSGWTVPLLTVGLIVVLELISNYIVEPWVYGTRTGISPGALLAAAIFWTWIWGMPGLLLATPLTVCIAVIGKYVPPLNFLAVLLGDEPVLPPEMRLYQRLLALDQEEASELVLAQLQEKTLAEVYDDTMIPALSLAERDHQSGTIDDRTQSLVSQAMRELVEEAGDWRRDLTRSEKKAEKEGADVSPSPPAPRPTVNALCVAAKDDADHVAALMAAQALRQIGFGAEVVAPETLTGELGEIVDETRVQMVLISDVPPSGFAQVRYICKRLAVKSPEIPIIVGVWGSNLDSAKARGRLPDMGTLHVVTSLKEAVVCAENMLEDLRFKAATDGRAPDERVAPNTNGRQSVAHPIGSSSGLAGEA
jgi:predicted PurR-regulated permease PerM